MTLTDLPSNDRSTTCASVVAPTLPQVRYKMCHSRATSNLLLADSCQNGHGHVQGRQRELELVEQNHLLNGHGGLHWRRHRVWELRREEFCKLDLRYNCRSWTRPQWRGHWTRVKDQRMQLLQCQNLAELLGNYEQRVWLLGRKLRWIMTRVIKIWHFDTFGQKINTVVP